MPQGVLPFKYEIERESTGLTALAGLPAWLELAHVLGMVEAADRHLVVRRDGQGWTSGAAYAPRPGALNEVPPCCIYAFPC